MFAASSVTGKKALASAGVSARFLASISLETFGAPAKVLKFDSAAAKVAAPSASQVAVKVNVSPVSVEDVRRIRGISFANTSTGLAGTTAVGTVSAVPAGETDLKVNDLVLIADSAAWANEVLVSKNNVVKLPKIAAEDAASIPSIVSAVGIFNLLPGLKAGDIVVQTDGESAVGKAIAAYGATLGVKVVSPTAAELADVNFAANTKSKGKVAHAISGSAGKGNSLLLKVIPHSGVLVVYNGVYQPLDKVTGIDVPISRAIFQDVKILGFDYSAFKRTSPGEFNNAVAKAVKLLEDKKVSLKAQAHNASDYATAVQQVETTGQLVALKF